MSFTITVRCVFAVVFFWQFVLPPGQGQVSLRVQVMGSTTFTNALSYTYGGATLLDVNPKVFTSDGNTLLFIRGLNLGIDLDQQYVAMAAAVGASETVAAKDSWIPNQVLLQLNNLQAPCAVQTVRLWTVVPRAVFCLFCTVRCL